MATVAVRSHFLRRISVKSWLHSNQRILGTGRIQVATLRTTYGEKFPYPDPWPYKEKKLTWLRELMDCQSLDRLNENSKIIIVEGNIAVGKNDFAKRLANCFDLLYVPSVHDDAVFQHYGHDQRLLDPFVSDDAKCYDIERFLSDPNPELGKVARLQLEYLRSQYIAYADACYHLFSTGNAHISNKGIKKHET